jgi:hypothetical protein
MIGYDTAKLGAGSIHFPHKRIFHATNGFPDLIPFPDQSDLAMYGNEVMDFTV